MIEVVKTLGDKFQTSFYGKLVNTSLIYINCNHLNGMLGGDEMENVDSNFDL